MKIIERKSAYQKRITCTKCTSILEYDANDIVWSSDPHALIRGFIICPVCHCKRHHGSGDIPTIESYIMFDENDIWNSKRIEFEDTIIADEDKVLIDKVIDKFADYSATDLVSLTHRQSPWIDAYAPYQYNEIPINAIREYFDS